MRDPCIKKTLKRSRSDKILTMMRKIENQESFITNETHKNFIVLPFNKPTRKSRILQTKRLNTSSSFMKNKAIFGDKENINDQNQSQKLDKNLKKEVIKNPTKIYTNDIFDAGYLSQITSRNHFLSDSIIKAGLSQRYTGNCQTLNSSQWKDIGARKRL